MDSWRRQLAPYLIILSVVGNLFLGAQLYQRDHDLNRITWGNYVDDVWKYLDWISHDIVPRSDGRVMTPAPQGLYQARESLEALRSLPHYSRRVDNADMRTLEHLVRYANESYALAVKEQGESGTVSAESVQRLTRLKEGLQEVVAHQRRTNQLKSGRNPWNHGEWRAVWRSVAATLRRVEFVPLPK